MSQLAIRLGHARRRRLGRSLALPESQPVASAGIRDFLRRAVLPLILPEARAAAEDVGAGQNAAQMQVYYG